MPKSPIFTAAPREEDVVGADVAVDDVHRLAAMVAGGVGRGEAGHDAARDPGGRQWRQPLTARLHRPQDVDEVAAIDVLDGHEVGAVHLTEVEELDDVLVLETDRDAGLVDEHRHEGSARRVLGQDALDDAGAGDAAKPRPREEDLRHAPHGEEFAQLVTAKGDGLAHEATLPGSPPRTRHRPRA
jgi:hypothetical protein